MRTIVTHGHLKDGAGRDWDAAMRTRLLAAKKRPGWVEDNSSCQPINETGE
jgi:hypothetical protein